MEIIVRLVIATVLLAFVVGVVSVGRALLLRRLARHRGEEAGDLVARYGIAPGRPGLLYFSTQHCVQCRVLQEPALDRLQQQVALSVVKIDAAHDRELARRFNIATVPSTVVIGPDHRVRGVNLGFTDAETLAGQLT